jgi:hypothetical protein
VQGILITLLMEAARKSETLVNFYQTTWHYNPEDSHLSDSWLQDLSTDIDLQESQTLAMDLTSANVLQLCHSTSYPTSLSP